MHAQIIGDNPYGKLICDYFKYHFPESIKPSKNDLVDILTDIIVGNKETRYGPIPPPEILVNIRKVIRSSINLDLPIPVLIPWGGRKTDPKSKIDIAEISALNQIINVDKLIKQFYLPGLLINMRVEDINAMWLYRADNELEKYVTNYSDAMDNLILILKGSSNITSMRESRMMDKDAYFETCKKYSILLNDTILNLEMFQNINPNDIDSYKDLVKLGWKGTIPKEQRDYYLSRYKHLYNATDKEAIQMLSDYFAGSKARYDLNAKGNPITLVEGFIQANFAHPVPNAPTGIFDTTVHWRTIPTSNARTHIAPWRGKGYIKIHKNEIKTKITSWSDKEILDQLESTEVLLTEGSINVLVQTNYLLSE